MPPPLPAARPCSRKTGSPWWDAGASGAIGLLLIGVAVLLAAENYSLLIGEAAPRPVEAAIRRAVDADEAVGRIVDLRTLHIGPRRVVVALGVEVSTDLSVPEVEAAVRRLETATMRVLGDQTDRALIVIEPMQGEHHEDHAARRHGSGKDLRAHLRQGR